MKPTQTRYGIYLGDLDRSKTSSHGIVNFATSTVKAMAGLLEPTERLVVLASESIRGELRSHPQMEIHTFRKMQHGIQRIWRDQVDVLRKARSRELDLLYFPKGFSPVFPSRIPIVATIHDDIALRYASGKYGLRAITPGILYASACTIATMRSAESVTTESSFSARRLAKWRGKRDPLLVTANAVPDGPLLAGASKSGICLFGSPLPHKRSSETLAWAVRFRDKRLPDEPVVVIGGPPIQATPGVTMVASPISNEEVRRHVANARMVAAGSEYEGFGMPALESWIWGTPTLHPDIEPYDETLPGVPGAYVLGSYSSFSAAAENLLELSNDDLLRVRSEITARFPATRPASILLAEFRRLTTSYQIEVKR